MSFCGKEVFLNLSEVWSARSKYPLSTNLYVAPPLPLFCPGANNPSEGGVATESGDSGVASPEVLDRCPSPLPTVAAAPTALGSAATARDSTPELPLFAATTEGLSALHLRSFVGLPAVLFASSSGWGHGEGGEGRGVEAGQVGGVPVVFMHVSSGWGHGESGEG